MKYPFLQAHLGLFFILLSSVSVWAQESDSTLTLPEVYIQENRISQTLGNTSRSVERVEKAELQKIPARSLAEVLSFQPGVDVRQRGTSGVQSDISIRGGGFEQTLIMINGLKLTDPQTGHHLMNLPFPMQAVEEIQIQKGPGARMFGQNAFSGAVNFVTKAPETRSLTLQAYGGDFGSRGAGLSLSLPVGENFRQFVAVSHDRAEGFSYRSDLKNSAGEDSTDFRTNSDYQITNLFYQGELDAAGGTFLLMGGHTDRAFGANGFYAGPNTMEWETVQTSIVSLSYTKEGEKVRFSPRIAWRRNQDEYIFIRDNPSVYRNMHISHTVSAELNTTYSSKLGETGFGLEARREALQSNNLGGNIRQIFGAFVEHRFQLHERLHFRPGAYLNYNSDWDWALFPGAELGYRVSSHLFAYANVETSYRVPTYTDLFYQGRSNIGNPNLTPERGLQYEAGLRYSRKGFDFQAAAFLMNANDLIDWTRPNEDTPWQPQNFTDVRRQGFELGANWQPHIFFGKEDFFLQKVSLSYTNIDAEIKAIEQNEISRYALNHLRHQFIAVLEHRVFGKLTHQARFRYAERFAAEEASFNVLDLRLNYVAKNYTFFAEATNVLNEAYVEAGMAPMPARWFRIGGQWQLNF